MSRTETTAAASPLVRIVTLALPAAEADQVILHQGFEALALEIGGPGAAGYGVTHANAVFEMVSMGDMDAAWDHAQYGDTPVDEEKLETMVNFRHHASGVEVDFPHYWDDDFALRNPGNADLAEVIQDCLRSVRAEAAARAGGAEDAAA